MLEGGGRWFMHGRLSVCFMYRWCLERDENGMYCLVYWFWLSARGKASGSCLWAVWMMIDAKG